MSHDSFVIINDSVLCFLIQSLFLEIKALWASQKKIMKWPSSLPVIPFGAKSIALVSAVKIDALKDKYPNFEVGLKCIIMVF